ncbi:hypothetical protein JDV02_008661 [Purpureocillium takamizusanense]|uniref:NACHT domain-containing protein n=1 Tax=Purpureocillium takamizusanense TaxID=2060973 RepID=A0A9Q8QQU5_9HYPO|nr:uncharacterized protein JDV02_008661 [Purpureocillium takamizusanense]UNI22807.1 hypothetical protein JDV02_008661 [Purpureocillium takamizusanense]
MPNPRDYTVGWICAITTEFVAAQAFLEEEHGRPDNLPQNDNNSYVLGKIGGHNVVIAVLPKSEYGTTAAATVASDMVHSFPNVRVGLMVGIGGGAPSPKHDIRLGDIVVGSRSGEKGGVFQYDYGKTIQNQDFVTTGHLNQAPPSILTAVSALDATYDRTGHQLYAKVDAALENIKQRKKYDRPDCTSDRLYQSTYLHQQNSSETCNDVCGNDPGHLVARPERGDDEGSPVIHYGLIASANTLMKDATVRDKLAVDKDVLCFEMEAAGLMNHFPCLVVRGICDYSDSHKNKEWQGYAAMTAAAYAKDLLCHILPHRVEAEKRIGDIILSGLQGGNHSQVVQVGANSGTIRDIMINNVVADDSCLKDLRLTDPRYDKERIKDTKGGLLGGSYKWILDHPDFRRWRNDDQSRLLWIKGDPGKGKTMLLMGIVEELERLPVQTKQTELSTSRPAALSYFFLQGTDLNLHSATAVLRGLIFLLAVQNQHLSTHLREKYEHSGPKLFSDGNAFFALSDVLRGMLQDSSLARTYVVIDALDECETGLQQLLKLIVQNASASRVKWIVSSRNRPDIEQQLKLDGSQTRLELELKANAEHVSLAVGSYIDERVSRLVSLQDDDELRHKVAEVLRRKADGTFLWVALVIQELQKVASWDVLDVLREMPSGLEELYGRMIKQIQQLKRRDPEFCRLVLSAATLAYRPLHMLELAALAGLPGAGCPLTKLPYLIA